MHIADMRRYASVDLGPFIITMFMLLALPMASSAQTLTVLVNFDGSNGANPWAPLVQGADGDFYGTTIAGYGNHGGWVFQVTPSGTLNPLYNFCSLPNCADGDGPIGGLVQAADGNFYGTTNIGGQYLQGTIFRMSPSGNLDTIYTFCSQAGCSDGENPGAGLLLANDGTLYGMTTYGGLCSGPCGTVFRITTSGALTTIYSFCSRANCADGNSPAGTLVQGTDGNFYGTTGMGGPNNPACFSGCGTIFRLTPAGTLTTIYNFCSQSNCADGSIPETGLVQATDGNFYGTTGVGGANNAGIVFRITPSGTFTVLHSFNPTSDGSEPFGTLIQATDGELYGTTENGADNNAGAIFRSTLDGTFTTMYKFCSQRCYDGDNPYSGLIQGDDGNFYGTTAFGGLGSDGTVFQLSGPTPTALEFVPSTPCRLVDTRQTHSPIQGGTSQTYVVSQLGNCNIPPNAVAYSLNVTVVPQHSLGYLTIWPAGRPRPPASTMNSRDGRVKANAAIVPGGASGAVSVFATDTTDVILDIDGFFVTPSSNTLAFYPLPPCRVVDTRGQNGDLGGPYLQGQVERDFPVRESSCVLSDANIAAYSVNFTAVPHQSGQQLSYLTAWAQGQSRPLVSTLNNPTATLVANAAIVPAGTNGGIAVYPSNDTDLLVDINGYFAAPATGGYSFYSVTPCRAYDSRNNGGQPYQGERTVDIVGSPCAPPSTAKGYVFNATVVPSGSMPYLTLWPDGETQPTVSTLNARDGYITSNMALVPNSNGSIDSYAAGLTQLILDISGYFAP
jgi:uncharacterized repeat protein (TIGR03803 family)